MKAALLWLAALLVFLCLAHPAVAAPPQVVVVQVHGNIWPGTAEFVKQQLDAAYKDGSAGVILDLDTRGGSAAAADEIKQALLDHAGAFPIAAFVHDHALGPGALIAVACKTLALAPGATLGAAEGVSAADLAGAATATGRNPAVATAFAAAQSDIPALGVKAGNSLTLTTRQAQGAGYADIVTALPSDVAAKMGPGLTGAQLVPVSLDPWMAAALWVTQPWATILLLVFGLALVAVELLTLHTWGIAGIIGGVVIAVIFAAYIAVGAATIIGVVLFMAGAGLLLLETHVLPGHGWPAFLGLTLIFAGLFFALGGQSGGALYPMAISLGTTLAVLAGFFVYLPRSGVWKRLGMPGRQTALAGYVSGDDYTGYLGQYGVAATLLRPSGVAEIDGIRLSVVSEGDFVPAGTQVQVVLVQGSRVVVRAVEQ